MPSHRPASRELQRSFLETCHRIVLDESLHEKVRLAHALTEHAYVQEIRSDVEKQDRTLLVPNSLGRYPYDLHPVGQLPRRPGRPIHFDLRDARDIPKRSSLKTLKGRQQLIHSLAHIELCAVEIDAAMLWRYPHAPLPWILDWVAILADEQKHFVLLCGLLKDLNMVYGDLPVHFGLWESAARGETWLEQLAIVNRYQEAGGVDASQALAESLREIQSQATAHIVEQIHDDEIKHVSMGTQWWNWAFSHYRWVERSNLPLGEEMAQYFFKIIEQRLPHPWSSRVPFDFKGRKRSGFSDFELKGLEKFTGKVESPASG